jgi:hypothetical protein
MLQISISTISRDLSFLREQAKINVRKYIEERLPEEYEKCLVGLTAILRESWTTAQNAEDKREKIQALSLAKECYSMKLDLLTNATVVSDAIRFVAEQSKAKEKLSLPSNEENNKQGSKEPHYNDNNNKESSEEQEEQGKVQMTTNTTNEVF